MPWPFLGAFAGLSVVMLIGWVVLGEAFTIKGAIGGALIVSGTLVLLF